MAKIKRGALTGKFKEAGSTKTGRVHIVPSESGWSVKKEGARRATTVHRTKEGALRAAGTLKSSSEIVVHKKDGKIQKITKKR